MRTFDFTVVVWKEKEGYVSKCPELGVASCGDSISEATSNLKEAVELYIENAEALGKGKITKGGATMKVADLSTDELKELIGKTIEEKFRELIDPDFGLELREDFIQALEASIASKERVAFDDVKKKLGLN